MDVLSFSPLSTQDAANLERFLAPSIGLAENIRQEFVCAIHQ
ncbi:unnamed protein product, partial [Didymodactylos carnosus]